MRILRDAATRLDDQLSLGTHGKTSGLQNLGSSVVHCEYLVPAWACR